MKTLVKWLSDDDYANVIEGFCILEFEKYQKIREKILQIQESFKISINGSSYLCYENGYVLVRELSSYDISDEEIKFLELRFGDRYGHFEWLDKFEDEED